MEKILWRNFLKNSILVNWVVFRHPTVSRWRKNDDEKINTSQNDAHRYGYNGENGASNLQIIFYYNIDNTIFKHFSNVYLQDNINEQGSALLIEDSDRTDDKTNYRYD